MCLPHTCHSCYTASWLHNLSKKFCIFSGNENSIWNSTVSSWLVPSLHLMRTEVKEVHTERFIQKTKRHTGNNTAVAENKSEIKKKKATDQIYLARVQGWMKLHQRITLENWRKAVFVVAGVPKLTTCWTTGYWKKMDEHSLMMIRRSSTTLAFHALLLWLWLWVCWCSFLPAYHRQAENYLIFIQYASLYSDAPQVESSNPAHCTPQVGLLFSDVLQTGKTSQVAVLPSSTFIWSTVKVYKSQSPV